MRYEKPVAMDLNARPASGQGPESCYDGSYPGAQGGYDVCWTGTGATSSFWPDCVNGPGATGQPGDPYEVCAGGSQAQPFCDMGTGAQVIMPDTCTAGPSDGP